MNLNIINVEFIKNKLEKEGELHIQKGDKTVHFYKFKEGDKIR